MQAGPVVSRVPVVLDSLGGRNMLLSLRKQPGMEAEDVLGDPATADGQPLSMLTIGIFC